MPHAALHAISFVAAAGFLLALSVPCAEAQAARGPEARALERAIRLLPRRPDVPIRLIDPELAADAEAVRRLDAFLVRERDGRLRRVIYLNSRAAMFERALGGADLDIGILAAVIQHELEHLRGASEADARRAERDFFQRLIVTGQVPAAEGRRYLTELEQERQPDEGQ